MKTLKEVIDVLGNKSYQRLEIRRYVERNGEMCDALVGICAYDNVGRLISLDGKTYTLDMICSQWKEFRIGKGTALCVYEFKD